MLQIALFVAIAVALVLYFCSKIRNKYQPIGFPPGPRQYPIIGNLMQFRQNPLRAMTDWKNRYGNIVGLRLGDFPAVLINDYDMIREAFSNTAFNGRPEFKPALLFTGGEEHGTLTSDGDPWDTIRRFTMKNLNMLGFGKKTMEHFFSWDVAALIESLNKDVNTLVDFKDKFYLPATNHLWYILIGKTIPDEQRDLFQQSLVSLNKALWLPIGSAIWFLPWLASILPNWSGLNQLKKVLPLVQTLVGNEASNFRRRQEDFKDTVGTSTSLMDAFCKEISNAVDDSRSHFHKQGGDNHMRGMILNLFVTAAEAMTNTMNWALLYLSLYPEAQNKLVDEIVHVIGFDRMPLLVDLQNMPYTKAVMSEVLRISSTSPFSNFQLTTEDVHNFHGYNIPKGTIIIANLYGIHHDEEKYPDPEKFDPERFLIAGGNSAPFVPFSVGLRTCLGQTFARNEFFLMLVSLCQKFRFEWDPNLKKPKPDDLTDLSHISIFRFSPEYKLLVKARWQNMAQAV